jgi:hypothetical protein
VAIIAKEKLEHKIVCWGQYVEVHNFSILKGMALCKFCKKQIQLCPTTNALNEQIGTTSFLGYRCESDDLRTV